MIDQTRVLSKLLAVILSGALLLIAACEFFLISFSGETPPHYNQLAEWFVYISALVVTPLTMALATKHATFKLVAIAWYQVTMGVLLLWFSEIFSPFTPVWSMFILFSSIYFGWRGFIGSSAGLIAIYILYILLFAGDFTATPVTPTFMVYAILSLMVVVMTIAISYLFVRIIMSSQRKNRELENAQKSEQLQINRLNTLLNSISDAVLTLNRYGRVTSQNAAAQVFFDTNESLIGRDIDSLFTLKDDLDKAVTLHSLIGEVKTTLTREDLSTGTNGDTRHLSLQISRIRSTYDDNEEYGVVLIIRDITKQKTLEEEKDEFISVTSHELRTPVAIAEGSLSNLLVIQERGAEASKLKEAAEMAHEQVVYLAKMINDLSTLSRAERGVGDVIEEINLNDLLNGLFTRYTPEAETKSLRLNLDVEANLPSIETSRLYLEEILQNFITNSIKYTKEGSVTLGAKLEPEGTKVKFFVKDTGIGMSKTDVAHIFEKFYRSEDYRTRETSGTGLGLYVVSKLAQKLNTKIEVESRLNHGSTFSFALSLHTEGFGSVTAHPTPDQSSSNPSLEVAEKVST